MKHIDLFSGIGGFALAARNVWGDEYNNVCFCEINKYAQAVLRKNFGKDVVIHEDIRKLQLAWVSADIVSGGFPCQDISYAKSWTTNGENTRNGIEGNRSGLWKEMLRIVSEVRPKFVVAENVKALTQGLLINQSG